MSAVSRRSESLRSSRLIPNLLYQRWRCRGHRRGSSQHLGTASMHTTLQLGQGRQLRYARHKSPSMTRPARSKRAASRGTSCTEHHAVNTCSRRFMRDILKSVATSPLLPLAQILTMTFRFPSGVRERSLPIAFAVGAATGCDHPIVCSIFTTNGLANGLGWDGME